TIAGTPGLGGYSGDGMPARAARLFNPQGLAIDAAGNLYIADTNNNRIRRIDTGGVITTVAGTGSQGFTGDGGSATAAAIQNPRFVAVDASGNLHFTEFGGSRVRRLNVAAKDLSVTRNTANVLARVELYLGRQAVDLSNVTLAAIDSNGRPISAAFPGVNMGPDPSEPGNTHKLIFRFSP